MNTEEDKKKKRIELIDSLPFEFYSGYVSGKEERKFEQTLTADEMIDKVKFNNVPIHNFVRGVKREMNKNRGRIVFVMRHGRASHNEDKSLASEFDTSLTDKARVEASKIKEAFNLMGLNRLFKSFHASHLKRAIDTTRLVTGANEVSLHKGAREWKNMDACNYLNERDMRDNQETLDEARDRLSETLKELPNGSFITVHGMSLGQILKEHNRIWGTFYNDFVKNWDLLVFRID